MLELTVNVEARRYHYTKGELINLKSALKSHGEKNLLCEDAIAAREEASRANGANMELRAQLAIAQEQIKDLTTARDVARYALNLYREDEKQATIRANDYKREYESERALRERYEKIFNDENRMRHVARIVPADNTIKLLVEQRDGFAEQLVTVAEYAAIFKAERDEAREIAQYFFSESIRYMFAHRFVSSERNHWIKQCAQLELEKLGVQCERDHAREVAIDTLHKLGTPSVIVIPFTGEIDLNELPASTPDEDERSCSPYDCEDCNNEHDEPAEQEPNANTGAAGGATHYDGGKLSFNNVPEEGERALVEVFSYGEKKYGFRNWEKTPGLTALQYYGSMRRHLQQWRASEDNDKESGLPHLAHVAANALMCLVTLRNDAASDNRKASL